MYQMCNTPLDLSPYGPTPSAFTAVCQSGGYFGSATSGTQLPVNALTGCGTYEMSSNQHYINEKVAAAENFFAAFQELQTSLKSMEKRVDLLEQQSQQYLARPTTTTTTTTTTTETAAATESGLQQQTLSVEQAGKAERETQNNFDFLNPSTPSFLPLGSTLESIIGQCGITTTTESSSKPAPASAATDNGKLLDTHAGGQQVNNDNNSPQEDEEEQHQQPQQFDVQTLIRNTMLEMAKKAGNVNFQVRTVLKNVKPLLQLVFNNKGLVNEDEQLLRRYITEQRVEMKKALGGGGGAGKKRSAPVATSETTGESSAETSQKRQKRSTPPPLATVELELIKQIVSKEDSLNLKRPDLVKLVLQAFQQKIESGDKSFHVRSPQQISYRIGQMLTSSAKKQQR